MDYDGRFLKQKTMDMSLLNDGMTLSVGTYAFLFFETSSFDT